MRKRPLWTVVFVLLAIGATLFWRRPKSVAVASVTPAPEMSAKAPAAPIEAVEEIPGKPVSASEKTAPSCPRRISGHVVTSDGAPAEGWCVVRSPWDEDHEYPKHRESFITGADGAFHFDGLEPDVYLVEARTSFKDMNPREKIDVADKSEVGDVVLRLREMTEVTVTVLDTRGAPVVGIPIDISPRRRTGPDGRAVLLVDEGEGSRILTISEQPPGFRTWLLPVSKWLQPEDTAVLFTLQDGAIVTGTVLTPEGNPAPDITLAEFVGEYSRTQENTDDNGRFQICVPLDGSVSLVVDNFALPPTVQAPDGSKRRVRGRIDGVRAGDRDLKLPLTYLANDLTLSVLALSPDGAAIEGAGVKLVEYFMQDRGKGATDSTGRIGFEALPPAPMTLTVTPPANGDTGDWMVAVMEEVVPQGQEVKIQFRVGHRISGVVLGPDSKPLDFTYLDATVPRDGKRHIERWIQAGPEGDWHSNDIAVDSTGHFSFLVEPGHTDKIELCASANDDDGLVDGVELIDPDRRDEIVIRMSK